MSAVPTALAAWRLESRVEAYGRLTLTVYTCVSLLPGSLSGGRMVKLIFRGTATERGYAVELYGDAYGGRSDSPMSAAMTAW